MASFFFSDIHLQPGDDSRSLRLSRFLNSLDTKTQRVFFLGDIFDFWMGGHQFWVDRYKAFVDAVIALRARNIEVYFFEGNHDIHVDPFFEKKLGVKVYTEPQVLSLHGLNVRIEHGDLFNTDDKNYLRLRKFLRSPLLRNLSFVVPGGFIGAIGDWGSSTSGKRTKRTGGRSPEVVADITRRTHLYFDRCIQEQKFDLMLMGHTHVREDFTKKVDGREVRFVNLGSWYEPVPQAFFIDDNGKSGYVPVEG